MESELLQQLLDKRLTKEALYRRVASNLELLPEIIKGISSSKAAVRYGCGKVLLDLSAKYPKKLYPYLDTLSALLDSKYRILTWNAVGIIANLCSVDEDKKFDLIFDKFYSFLDNEYMVTVANVVGNSDKIALAKPYLIPKIVNKLLTVENARTTPHLTDECKLVIMTHAINCFDAFFDRISDEEKAKVCAFVKRHANSQREQLRLTAKAFLIRWMI
jgi:hypothetical protein